MTSQQSLLNTVEMEIEHLYKNTGLDQLFTEDDVRRLTVDKFTGVYEIKTYIRLHIIFFNN